MPEPHPGYFTQDLATTDPALAAALDGELVPVSRIRSS